ncbi:hypothetical protein C3K47_07910 [Solitalea longa]|uniref:Uncharacterized protein n=1 Tax=Solitalea longa TaxID=2079460 RepID=A0A2S5A3U0_9SPHI|nr:hypothetical protein [Solitalea longa]POY36977.1 hypothetical protein C3K47_07910 [Solitalea longa]
MNEDRARILKESVAFINRLQLLSAFFEEEIVYKIYLRSQIIHRSFENNTEIDINKLELFHLQFTSSVIELLKKIKKSNEQKIKLIYDEIDLNTALVEKLHNSTSNEADFDEERAEHIKKINLSIQNLYNNLSDYSKDNPFAKNINEFAIRYAKEFFHDITTDVFNQLIHHDSDDVYKNAYATIHKKLLGIQCKYNFKNTFIGGLRSGDEVLEVYKIMGTSKYFVYYGESRLFLLCDIATIQNVDWKNTVSKKVKIIQDMEDRNCLLETQVTITKSYISEDAKQLLTAYYDKIEDVSFLENITNIDVQANILKTMLNTDLM